MIHLHVHTSASDGLGTLDALFQQVKDTRATAVAITDHGSILNWLPFQHMASLHGVKPILGVEAYYAPYPDSKKFHHITLLAMNRVGFDNVIRLQNEAHKSVYKKPAITPEQLGEYNEGVILLSGCQGTPLLSNDQDVISKFIHTAQTFFTNRFYIELMPGVMSQEHIDTLLVHRDELHVPLVFTSDVHYMKKKHAELHNRINKIRFGYTFNNEGLWMKSASEMEHAANKCGMSQQDIMKGMMTPAVIAERIEEYDVGSTVTLPVKPLDAIMLEGSLYAELAHYTIGMPSEQRKVYDERVNYELGIIKGKGFLEYFWLVREVVQHAKEQGIKIGPARGSAAGSLTSFLLGITSVDPIKYGLIFERFLNPERSGYPDIDVDIQADRRQEVIDYANERWGAIPIFTTSLWGHKSLTHDLCKTFKVKYDTRIKAAANETSDEHLNLMQNDEYRLAYNTVLGQMRHKGKHASGFAITSGLMPIERMSGHVLACPIGEGTHGSFLDKMGLIKFDLLGLNALSGIAKMEQMAGCKAVPFGKDKKTMQLFRDGNVSGVFQFSSSGMRDLVQRMSIQTNTDIAACIALYRPGTLDVKADEAYILNTPVTIHPQVDKILEDTHGIMLYQETVMNLFMVVAGVSMAEADKLRKLIAKKRDDDPRWNALHTMFIDGGKRLGISEHTISKLWSDIVAHSGYSFNKCVSGDMHIVRDNYARLKRPMTIREMYDTLHNAKTSREGYGKGLSLVDGRVKLNGIVDIRYEGIRNVYRITLESSHSIDVTSNHKFPTEYGEVTIDSGLQVGTRLYVKGERGYSTALQRVVSIEHVGKTDVYDVEMEAPLHTVVVNDIVASNSHAISYAHISWTTAWFKANYPAVFYASVLTFDKNNKAQHVFEMVQSGIQLLSPSINHSHATEYMVDEDGNVRLPLESVVGLGQISANAIVNERANGNFLSCEDFTLRVSKRNANARVRKALYMLNAFSSFGDIEHLLLSADVVTASRKDTRAIEREYLGISLPTAKLIVDVDNYELQKDTALGIVFQHNKKKRDDGSTLHIISLHNGTTLFSGKDIELGEGDVAYFTLKPYSRSITGATILT